jgi:3-oxoacyl-[acyl-carrier protein] reductase
MVYPFSIMAYDFQYSLAGHVALITGSSRGLGKAVAMGLGKKGAKVAFNYLNNTAAAEATFAEFQAAGGQGMLVRADASDPAAIADMVQQVESQLGVVDILVPNATPVQPLKPIEEYDWAFAQQMLDFFVKSPFLLCQAIIPGMKAKKWGRIINIGSEVFQKSVPNFTPYVSAKGGQLGLTRSLASELAPFGITANLIAPGWIPTERHDTDAQEDKDAYFRTIPMGRWGRPEDVAAAAVYFASEEASFISGQTLCVNGGSSPW